MNLDTRQPLVIVAVVIALLLPCVAQAQDTAETLRIKAEQGDAAAYIYGDFDQLWYKYCLLNCFFV